MGQAKDLYDGFWAHVVRGDLDAAMALVGPGAHAQLPGAEPHGREELRAVLEQWRAAFSDVAHEVVDHLDAGGAYADEAVITGTHTGPLRAPDGREIPPTGRRVTYRAAHLVRAGEGAPASWHAYYDQGAVLAQLGAQA